MTEKKKRILTVVSNNTDINTGTTERARQRDNVTQPNADYHTNPMYEKLLQFQENQKKKRFTVEDLLKW